MRSVTDQAILHHLHLLSDQVMGLSHDATLAIEAMTVDRSRNQAVGTLLPMRERLRLASQLLEVILAVHRLAPSDGHGGAP